PPHPLTLRPSSPTRRSSDLPVVGGHSAGGVRRILEHVVFRIRLTVNHGLDLGADRDQRFAEAIELVLRFALGRLDHDGSRDRKRSEEHTSELQSLAYLVCRL